LTAIITARERRIAQLQLDIQRKGLEHELLKTEADRPAFPGESWYRYYTGLNEAYKRVKLLKTEVDETPYLKETLLDKIVIFLAEWALKERLP